MSSVRISHHRGAAASVGPAGEAGRSETPLGGASFASTLGAAGLLQKGGGAPATSKTGNGTDGTARKRSESDGKGADAAALLAAQGSLLIAEGDLISGARLPAGAHAALPDAADAKLRTGALSAIQQNSTDTAEAATEASGKATSQLQLGESSSSATGQGQWDQALLSTSGSTPALDTDAAPDKALDTLSKLGPQLAPTPSASPVPAAPIVLAALAQAIPGVAAGQPGTGGQNGAFSDAGRHRSVQNPVATTGDSAAEAAGLGASSELSAPAPSAPAAANAAEAASNASVSDQIAGHVIRMLTSGSREMVMRLHPPELGEVTVRVAVNGRDVSAWFGSSQPQVQTAITDGIGQLQAGLGNAGYNLNGAWVGADASGGRDQSANLPPSPTVAPVAAAPGIGMTATRSSASGLNIYV